MHPLTQEYPPDEGKAYLGTLQALSAELETAMHAIACQEIVRLRESLRVQQALCWRLAQTRRVRRTARLRDSGRTETGFDFDLTSQIEEAIAAVVLLNQRYAALLKHSGETLRLFAGLFRSYQDPTQPTSGIQVNHTTWSCEV